MLYFSSKRVALPIATWLALAVSSCSTRTPEAVGPDGGAGSGSGGSPAVSAASTGPAGGSPSSAQSSTGSVSAAASTTNSSSVSSGSGPSECSSPADCPGVDTDCAFRECTNGKCSIAYHEDEPILTQIAGNCDVTVCDGSGGTKQLYDSADVEQTEGDCSTAVCVGVGQITQQPTMADVPVSTECHTGACSATGPTQQPVADGTTCSIGLCKVGVCVKQIPVCCSTNGNGTYCGCNGNPNPMPQIAVYWNDSSGVQHSCSGSDSSKVEYCKPGTACIALNFSSSYSGVCL